MSPSEILLVSAADPDVPYHRVSKECSIVDYANEDLLGLILEIR